jgi:YegS/Rv2252/BmrU family lipid kinase
MTGPYRHTVLILNPGSRSGADPAAEAIDRLLQLGPVHAFRVDETDSARNAILELGGPDVRVVLGGGDGTLSFLLDAVLESGSTLGVLPLGTANDFARSLQIPLNLRDAAEVIAAGHSRDVDVGEVNGRRFLNAVGVGIGPEVTQEMDADAKGQLGVFAYPVALLSVLREAEPFRATLEIDGIPTTLECLQVTIGNGIHYGGGMTVSNDARLDDGQLAVLCIREQPTWQLASHAMALRNGDADALDGIEVFTGKHVRLQTDVPMKASADGELVCETPLECHSRHAALRVFAPNLTAGANGD